MSKCKQFKKQLDEIKDMKAALDTAVEQGRINDAANERNNISQKIHELRKDLDPKPRREVFRNAVEKIEKANPGLKIVGFDSWDTYRDVNGELNGRIQVYPKDDFSLGALMLEDNKRVWLPVINGELIREFKGEKITSCDTIENINGNLNGSVEILGQSIPVINGELIDTITSKGNKYAITSSKNVKNINGKLNGEVHVNNSWLPVIDGELVLKVGNQSVSNCKNIENIDGTLNGITVNSMGHHDIVVMGNPISTIDGEEITGADSMKIIDGKPNGIVSSNFGQNWKPLINGKVIHEIDGKKIMWCKQAENHDNKLTGLVILEGSKDFFPVIKGELITEIGGTQIRTFGELEVQNGEINGIAFIKDVMGSYPCLNGTVAVGLKKYGDIQSAERIRTIAGLLNGIITARDAGGKTRVLYYVLGKVIKEVEV